MEKLSRRKLGQQGLEVGCVGLGCMGMSAFYTTNPGAEHEYIKVIQEAVEAGCILDTSDIYGPFTNEELVGKAIVGLPRENVIVATKFGFIMTKEGSKLDCSRQHVREACLASLKRLGVDYIDLYYMHRKDPNVPIEETIAEMKLLVEEGKVKYIGVSETNEADIRKAHKIHPLSAVQLEWSLWTRDCEADIVPLCRELGIGIVAYSPLGRGFLTGKIKTPEDLDEEDWRRNNPRFQPEAFNKNMALVKAVTVLADHHGVTPGQMAIAWVLRQGEDVVPIPGTRRAKYLEENLKSASIKLSDEEFKKMCKIADPKSVYGDRYDEAYMKMTYKGYSDPTTRMRPIGILGD